MAGVSKRIWRRWTARSGLGALIVCAIAPTVEAQWLPPLGAAPPNEIAQRLRAQGFVLAGPLYRRNSVYVVDVSAGPEGRERLIVDAWSGEVLQRFVARRGRWRPEFGGEFGEPPGVFGPPPASEFYTAGAGGAPEEPARAKPKPRAAETGRQPARAAPATSAQPENAQNGGSNPAPSNVGAPPSAPVSAAPPPPAAPSPQPTATANGATSAPNASEGAPAAANSAASSAPSSETKQEVPKGAATAGLDADKPNTNSAVKAEAQSAGAASGAPRAEKQEAPQAAGAPQASVDSEKSEKPTSSAPAQSASAAPSPAAAKPSIPAPAAQSGRKSRVNDIPAMPLE